MSTYNYAPGAVHLDIHHNNISTMPSMIRELVHSFASNAAPNDVADAILQFKAPQFDNMLYDCLQERKQHGLSDWAYYQMLLTLTRYFYGEESNEGALVLAFLYSHSGYKMRLAHDGSRLYMLIASGHLIFNKSMYYTDGDFYYLLDGNRKDALTICKASFPHETPLSLQMSATLDLDENPTVQRTISSKVDENFTFTLTSNKNYIDFYSTYPASSINNDFMTRWAMYANTPIEKGIVEQLYPQMKEKLQGLSEVEAVGKMLSWVQTGFEYEYDDNVWGFDRAFFAEESLFYPFCDCEDRSILLSHLVRDLLGLDVVLVYYPGHLAMAVHFNENEVGDHVTYNGKKFVVCDPTYIGASVGESMPMLSKEVTLILLNR